MKNLIGLVLAHHVTNYGALLQAYAVQTAVESLGFSTKIIDYKSHKFQRGIKFDFGIVAWLWDSLKSKYSKKKFNQTPLDEIHLNNKRNRKLRFNEFNTEMLHNIEVFNGIDALRNSAKNCKGVLIGSDQMWLPGVSFGNYQSLRFVPKGVRRISYATSLGVSKYPKYCYRSAKDMWKNIDFLSVREEQGKAIINDIAPDLNVEVVLDPTYLFSKDEWEKRIPIKRMTEEKYVLCYFLGNSESQQKMAQEFCNRKGLKCYSILSDESISAIDTTFPDKVITGGSAQDFVNWIRGAEYIITDSFHGLAFSVINEKQFFVFYRQRIDHKPNRNSRINNILSKFNCQSRLITNDQTNIPDINPINYNEVSEILSDLRSKSWRFLKNALTFKE